MNDEQFKHEYYHCKWHLDPRAERLNELAHKYHMTCEIYDKTVCRGVSYYDGTAMPLSTWERCMISKNASEVLQMIYIEASKDNFSNQEVRNAICRWNGKLK